MRGLDHRQSQMFGYMSPETRVRKDHPQRAIRFTVDEVLIQLSRRFDTMHASASPPSIPPEKLLRAQLPQMLNSIRSERLLMDETDYSALFRWFVGLSAPKSSHHLRKSRNARPRWLYLAFSSGSSSAKLFSIWEK